MEAFVDQFREKLLSKISKDSLKLDDKEINKAIGLGVLLRIVAEADKQLLPEEEDKVKDVLASHAKIPEEQIQIVLATIKQATEDRIDMWSFTNLFVRILNEEKIPIVENLFRVACADKDLDFDETETIRKMANLMMVSHRDFINAKIKVKRELGLDTV